MNWYKRFPGDWKRDTGHLSIVEKGVYSELLDHYYSTEEPLPAETRTLCRIAGAIDEEEVKAVRRVAAEFFPVNGNGTRHNKRADKEIEKAKAKSKVRSEAAAARWKRKE